MPKKKLKDCTIQDIKNMCDNCDCMKCPFYSYLYRLCKIDDCLIEEGFDLEQEIEVDGDEYEKPN